jgi:type VI secretion system protein ImpF
MTSGFRQDEAKRDMAPKRSDRLASSLMHVFRVTQDANDAKFVGPNPREDGRAAMVRADLRRETVSDRMFAELVRTDVIALLNTVRLESAQSLDETPNVARSILNYGFPDLMNHTYDDNRTDEIATEIERMLCRYEPRIAPGSVKARYDRSSNRGPAPKVRFVVHAALKAKPVDLPIEFIAEIEASTGKIKIDPT